MPIVVPGRRIGTAFASHTAIANRLAKRRRSVYAALLLTSLVDMFTILVLYLIQQFNATGQILFIDPDIILPKARTASALVGSPPVVTISQTQISIQGRAVDETKLFATEGVWEAPRLEQALLELRSSAGALADITPNGGEPTGRQTLVVQADLGVPYMLVKKVIFTAQKTGFSRVDFAVSQALDPEKP
ncbi:MAG: biopolymer transporter ExbD [Clostridia bacterium]|nr:biopolymer transporter ExbD [Deltaproteobacteria bacterium]